MKITVGIQTLALTLGLIVGGIAAAQQQQQQKPKSGQQTPNQTQVIQGQTQTDQPPKNQNRDTTLQNRNAQGMYDVYRRHWDARFQDPAFMTYREQQIQKFNENQARIQALSRDQAAAARARNQQRPTSYEQFSQDRSLWVDRNAGARAWQQGDAYWRMSDQYWRDPARRQNEGFDAYWRSSQAYWNDSDRYWDDFFSNTGDDRIDNDRNTLVPDDRERTNR